MAKSRLEYGNWAQKQREKMQKEMEKEKKDKEEVKDDINTAYDDNVTAIEEGDESMSYNTKMFIGIGIIFFIILLLR